jgi:hypothetical protein
VPLAGWRTAGSRLPGGLVRLLPPDFVSPDKALADLMKERHAVLA